MAARAARGARSALEGPREAPRRASGAGCRAAAQSAAKGGRERRAAQIACSSAFNFQAINRLTK
eukprot:scaffold62891_cov75-Phaeocystis_antarctica.AAC.2